ncbi:MAG: nucleotidyl transferase AbiEii/AbiGii toxin family protein [Erysipelotrichaceae bacterium]|nr:nucleotidyl transferase AbiEii/AbiGii toxin family protein [Erysipelotrichaceae bacterium]
MILYEEIEKIKTEGYSEANAQSKLGQEIILKAISDSGLAGNVTIKGGVVIRSISGNSRRSTQDLDLDFIRYSISDDSIREFVRKLDCIDGLDIGFDGNIVPLNHLDYKGKRIFITVSDTEGTVLSLKMDLGVHKDLSIEQEEYAFDVGFQDDAISLLINSPAQMFTEKLKSLLRFGTSSTRYKDVFDICYLCSLVDRNQMKNCINKFIFNDNTLHNISTMKAIVRRLERTFSNSRYLNELQKSDKNWLNSSTEEAISRILEFIRSID